MQVWTWVCGNTAVIASGKPFNPSTTAMSMSSTPRFLSSVITRSQNVAPSMARRPSIRSSEKTLSADSGGGLLDPEAEDLLAAVGTDAESDVDRLVADGALIAHLHA
jgi:hypothetical protein